jgi:hypothetical protein
MTGMKPLLERHWLTIAVLVVVFLGGVSMHMERMMGWGFFVLCFIVGSVAGLSFTWGRERFLLHWNGLSKSRRRIAIAAGLSLYIIGNFIANRHKPDEAFHDTMTCLLVLGLLLFWGLYRITSHFLDALHARFSKR